MYNNIISLRLSYTKLLSISFIGNTGEAYLVKVEKLKKEAFGSQGDDGTFNLFHYCKFVFTEKPINIDIMYPE